MAYSDNVQLSDSGWALILPGGGNRGAIQAGALLALFERGFVPELIVGVSAGAINGAYLAFHPSLEGVRDIVEIWRGLTGRSLFGTRLPSLRRLAAFVFGRAAAFKNDGLEHLLVENLPYRRFEDTAVPLVVAATHLETGTGRALESGDLVKAVLASAALPAVLPPVTVDGELLVDGAVADPIPIHVATERGFTRVMVVEPGYSCACPRVFESAQSIFGQALAIMARERLHLELQAYSKSVNVVHLGLTCHADRPISDFSATKQMIASGHSEAALKLDAVFGGRESTLVSQSSCYLTVVKPTETDLARHQFAEAATQLKYRKEIQGMSLFKKQSPAEESPSSQPAMDMGPMVGMLAKAPEEQRQQMLTDRLTVFADQDSDTRNRGMGAMLAAALKLPDDDYQKIAGTRLAVLGQFAPDQRMELMKSHAAAIKGLPEDLRMKEMRVMKSVLAELPSDKRQMMEATMKDLGMMG